MHIVGIVVVFISLALWLAISKDFKDKTGVAPPTRKQWTASKRRARARGISDEQALDNWIARKKRRG